nr:alpha/beta fold hydrolase [uncultured Celeribacter sp.]
MTPTRRTVLMGATALALSACAPPSLRRPSLSAEAPAPQDLREILAITDRTVAPSEDLAFEGRRSDQLFYRGYRISVPPDRDAGQYSLPRSPVDPQREFFVNDSQAFDGPKGYLAALNRQLRALPPTERNAVIFVHGYNVSYPGAVFRAAQIATDFELQQPMTVFSWPSAARLSRYAYDRDSVLFARAALAETLQVMARSAARNITVIGHSMGGLLVMEALKRLALSGDRTTLSRMNGALLVQPDIDVDVFRKQVLDLQPYKVELAVVASQRDRALKLSAVLTGGHPRVGEAANIPELRDLGVAVLDVTQARDRDPLGHSGLLRSPELLQMVASGELESIVAGAPGQDILIDGLSLTGNAALAIAYLPYTVTGG